MKRLLRILLPLVLLSALAVLAGMRYGSLRARPGFEGKTLLINEVCARNLTGITDGNGCTADWIELCNVSGQPVSLSGWSLSDDEARPRRWMFPEDAVLDGGVNNILLLFADGSGVQDAAGALHVGFSLSAQGETLYLYNAQGELVDSLTFPAMPYDMTYGRRLNDGGSTGFLASATPGTANPADFWEKETPTAPLGGVDFSLPGGFYAEACVLTLTPEDPDALVLYTLDGSVPGLNSAFYTGPLTLSRTEGQSARYAALPAAMQQGALKNYALRYAVEPQDQAVTVTARLYKDGILSETVSSRTFWVGVQPHTLPVAVLDCEPEELFGAQGIYLPGTTYFTAAKYGNYGVSGNYDAGTAIPGRAALYDTDGTLLWQDAVSVKVSGGWSRHDSALKNLHLKLSTASDALLPQEMGGAANAAVLRGTGNGSVFTALHQDAFWNNYLYGEGIGAQWNRPVALYLQGEYWGTYTIRESKNEDFFFRHFGVERDDLICPGVTEHPDTQNEKYAFGAAVDALDCTREQDMLWVEQNVDVDGFIQYLIAQMYLYNADGLYNGGNNSILWKSAGEGDTRWHFVLNDLDATMGDVEVDPFAKLLAEDYSMAVLESAPWYSVTCNLFQKLWQNAGFRQRFADRYREQMATLYAPEQLLPAFDAWCAMLRPEVGRDLARQRTEQTALAPLAELLTGGAPAAFTMTSEEWEQNNEAVRAFLTRRSEVMVRYLDAYLALEGGLPDA